MSDRQKRQAEWLLNLLNDTPVRPATGTPRRSLTEMARLGAVDTTLCLSSVDWGKGFLDREPQVVSVAWPVKWSILVTPRRPADGLVARIPSAQRDVEAIFYGCRTITPQEGRGRIARIRPRMLVLVEAILRTGTWEMQVTHLSLNSDNEIGVNEHGVRLDAQGIAEAGDKVQLVAARQIEAEYDWHVTLRRGATGLPLRIPTDPLGAREILRLRDIPDGRKRREALLHWVEGHTRVRGRGTDRETASWVRNHLRGAMRFSWDGLEGWVTPSVSDVRRLTT